MTLKLLAFAILLCRPSMPHATASSYASLVSERASALHVDPLMMVAVIDHESGWIERAISKDGEDFGLGQIRARYMLSCANDANPVHAPSAKCAAEKARLLTGAYNIEAMGRAIERWIAVCKQKTGAATEVGVLASYAGLNRPKLGQWCGMVTDKGTGKWVPLPIPSVVRAFLQRRRNLRLQIEAHG